MISIQKPPLSPEEYDRRREAFQLYIRPYLERIRALNNRFPPGYIFNAAENSIRPIHQLNWPEWAIKEEEQIHLHLREICKLIFETE